MVLILFVAVHGSKGRMSWFVYSHEVSTEIIGKDGQVIRDWAVKKARPDTRLPQSHTGDIVIVIALALSV